MLNSKELRLLSKNEYRSRLSILFYIGQHGKGNISREISEPDSNLVILSFGFPYVKHEWVLSTFHIFALPGPLVLTVAVF
jgi:hypothetical protein